ETAWISFHAFNETTGKFNDTPMAFYYPADPGSPKAHYDWDPAKQEYVKVEDTKGHFERVEHCKHTFKTDSATSPVGALLPFPLEKSTISYQVRVSNVLNDLTPDIYTLTLNRRVNSLDVANIRFNSRKALPLYSQQLAVELKDGALHVKGALVDGLKRDYPANTISTKLTAAQTDFMRMTQDASGKLLIEKNLGTAATPNWSTSRAVAGMENLHVYKIQVSKGTVGNTVLSATARDAATHVDVDGDLLFSDKTTETTNKPVIDTHAMKVGDTMFYPILVGSRDLYHLPGGTATLPDEIGIVVLQVSMVERIEDLDVKIIVGSSAADNSTWLEAQVGEPEVTQETLSWSKNPLSSSTVYHRTAIVSTTTTTAWIMAEAGMESSTVTIRSDDAAGSILSRDLAHTSALREMELSGPTYV
ncbi:MAG: hypothetical protein RSB55_09760, partial [Oscillospiraceae bacterium]